MIFILISLFIYIKGYKLNGKVLYEVREKVAQLNCKSTHETKTEDKNIILESVNN